MSNYISQRLELRQLIKPVIESYRRHYGHCYKVADELSINVETVKEVLVFVKRHFKFSSTKILKEFLLNDDMHAILQEAIEREGFIK